MPPGDVVQAFEQLAAECVTHGNIEQPITSYFEDTYIGARRGAVRKNPLFPIAMWNVCDRMAGGLPRTNNSLEGWHRGFSSTISSSQPDIYKLVRALRREEATARVTMAHIEAGLAPPRPKLQYRRIENNLTTIFNDYPNRNRLDYLRGISYNLHEH